MTMLQRLRNRFRRSSATTTEPGPERSPYVPWKRLPDAPESAWQANETVAEWGRRIRRGRDEEGGF